MKKSWILFVAAIVVLCVGGIFYYVGFSMRSASLESALPDVLMGVALFGVTIVLAGYGWIHRLGELRQIKEERESGGR